MKNLSYTILSILIMSTLAHSSRDSGGGEHIAEPRATIAEIDHIVEKIKPTLWSKFYGLLVSNFGDDPKHRFIYMKLFDHDPDESLSLKLPPGKKDDREYMKATFPYFKQLDRSTFFVEKEKSCYDGNIPKDAAVVDKEKGLICISAFNLSKKIPGSRVFEDLSAIMAHEVSHLVDGISEDEAQTLQDKYFTKTTSKSVMTTFFEDLGKVGDPMSNLKYLLEPKWDRAINLNNPVITERCLGVGTVNVETNNLSRELYKYTAKYGTLIIDETIRYEIGLLNHRLSYLRLYCLAEENHLKQYILKYSKSVVVPGETDGFYLEGSINSPASYYFRYIGYLDNVKMREEMNSLLKKIDQIQAMIWKNEEEFRKGLWERGVFK